MELLAVAFFGTAIPIGFFTMFYDNAAVFERTKVFESIRRSIEVVLRNPGASLGFLFVSILVSGIILFGLMVAWTGILYDQLLPLTLLSPEELQQITLDSINQTSWPGWNSDYCRDGICGHHPRVLDPVYIQGFAVPVNCRPRPRSQRGTRYRGSSTVKAAGSNIPDFFF